MNQDRASTITNPQLKEGYKQTEVGVIPENWDLIDMSDLCLLQRGFDITEATRTRGDIPVYSSSGIAYFHNKALVSPPGVVTGRKGILGKVFFIKEPFWPHDTTLWVKDFRGNYPAYVAIALKNFHLERLDAATSVPTLNRNNLAGYLIPHPPLAEQEAIACTLSDIDALIESLDRLLTKKHQIKQGAMQELLMGKKRLMGFSGEWESKTFGEIFDYRSTATNSRSDLTEDGDTYYIHYGDIHMKFHSHLDFNYDHPPKINRQLCENATLLQNGDWIMADASEDLDGVGKLVEIIGLDDSISVIAGLHTFVLREKIEMFAPRFKGHLGNLKSLHDELLRIATGMKVFGISKTALKELTLPVPPLPEQIEIANILSDMDAEIESISAKLTKTRQLKQGMMHELLRGRIRLVG
jgi:type I restriction enzyme, S subunit